MLPLPPPAPMRMLASSMAPSCRFARPGGSRASTSTRTAAIRDTPSARAGRHVRRGWRYVEHRHGPGEAARRTGLAAGPRRSPPTPTGPDSSARCHVAAVASPAVMSRRIFGAAGAHEQATGERQDRRDTPAQGVLGEHPYNCPVVQDSVSETMSRTSQSGPRRVSARLRSDTSLPSVCRMSGKASAKDDRQRPGGSPIRACGEGIRANPRVFADGKQVAGDAWLDAARKVFRNVVARAIDFEDERSERHGADLEGHRQALCSVPWQGAERMARGHAPPSRLGRARQGSARARRCERCQIAGQEDPEEAATRMMVRAASRRWRTRRGRAAGKRPADTRTCSCDPSGIRRCAKPSETTRPPKTAW
jgi:hypothetical protein